MRHDDPHIRSAHRNAVADPAYSEKLEAAARERAMENKELAYRQHLGAQMQNAVPTFPDVIASGRKNMRRLRAQELAKDRMASQSALFYVGQQPAVEKLLADLLCQFDEAVGEISMVLGSPLFPRPLRGQILEILRPWYLDVQQLRLDPRKEPEDVRTEDAKSHDRIKSCDDERREPDANENTYRRLKRDADEDQAALTEKYRNYVEGLKPRTSYPVGHILVDALKALKMTGGEDFQNQVIERLENEVCASALAPSFEERLRRLEMANLGRP